MITTVTTGAQGAIASAPRHCYDGNGEHTITHKEPIMNKRLSVIGDSLGVIIDQPILEQLNINQDTVLELKIDGATLMIRPAPTAPTEPAAPTRAQRIKAASEIIANTHAEAFEKLAR